MSEDEGNVPQPQPIAIAPQPLPQPQPIAIAPQAPILPTPQQVQQVEPVETQMATAEAPVTGQARMDTAWGSSEGDEDVSEMASIGPTGSGEIFQQNYEPWRGELNPRWMRNWAILRHHILGIFKKGHRPWGVPTRIFLVLVFFASLSDAALTLLSSLIGDSEFHSMWGVN